MMEDRMMRALLGAFVGDAASLGTHWIYNPKEMASTVHSIAAPEFREPPAMKFYSPAEYPGRYATGMLSPYGEQLLFVAEHVAREGTVDGAKMVAATRAWATKHFEGRKDHALTQFLAKDAPKSTESWREAGVDDNQAHNFMKVVPVTIMYAGLPERKEKVETAIRTLQDNEQAVALGLAASDILEKTLLGEDVGPAAAFDAVVSDTTTYAPDVLSAFEEAKVDRPLEQLLLDLSHKVMKDKPDSPFYDLAGRSCAMPGAFIAVAHHFAAKAKATTDESKDADGPYAKAIRANIIGSGDTCSRAVFLGAVFGAAYGPPPEWLDKLTTTHHPATGDVVDLVPLLKSIATQLIAINKRLRAERGSEL